MNVTYYNRPKMKGAFSEETVFGIIKRELKGKIQFSDYYCSSRWGRMSSLLNAYKYQGDVNHITGDVFHLALVLDSSKTVITVHDIGHYERTLQGIKKYAWKYWMYNLPFSNCRFITTISEFTKKKILQHTSANPQKIKVIYNPAPSDFAFSPKEFNSSKPWVLQIGSGDHKNLSRLIKAIDGEHFRLLLIRGNDPIIREELEEKGIEYEWHSNISREKVYECYQKCDMVFFASEYEGFGVPILEGNAVGRPVITSNVASTPEVAGKGALIVDPYNIRDIREALLKIKEKDNLRNELIENGRKNLKRFAPNKIANKYLELYKSIRSF